MKDKSHLSARDIKEAIERASIKPYEDNSKMPEFLRIVVYLVPVAPAYFLVSQNYANDKLAVWHMRQSLVNQACFITLYMFFNIINLLTLSNILSTIAGVLGFGLAFIASVAFYNNEKFKIPGLYKMFKKFIEG